MTTATRLLVSLLSIVLVGAWTRSGAQVAEVDVLVRRARVIDGTGNPWYVADVAIAGDTIAAIGHALQVRARRAMDGAGLVVSPGFIDVHSHARRGLFDVPTAENYVRQGVTTIIEGPDGSSALPIAGFLEDVRRIRPAINVGTFVGQGSVRQAVMGNVDRAASPAELERMRGLVRQGMQEGAFGLSSGLFYPPGAFTPPSEVHELAKVAGALGGSYTSHMRDEAARVIDSVRETIAVGEAAGLPAQITHHKVIGAPNWGRSVDTLRIVAEARARGVDVTLDQYPYTASATDIEALLPRWALEGTSADVRARLKDPPQRAKIKAAIVDSIRVDRGGGDPHNVQVAACTWDPSLAGRRLDEITRSRGAEPTLEHAAETVLWIVEQGGARGIFHAIGEEDLRRILAWPWTMIASDGEVPIFGRQAPHPRSYGTFARVLGHYVRDARVLTLEDAVRKMSSLPAQRLGLLDRGVLRPGMKADVAIFDPARIADRATFEQPHQYADGVVTVLVNGEIVYDQGAMTAARPGKALHRQKH
jgi:dihydroorotase/N-acyl-D-amino-acid deacylase